METWSNFTTVDTFTAVIGFIGLLSVLIVLKTAFGNVDKLERNRKNG
jgi:hypothetical protein